MLVVERKVYYCEFCKRHRLTKSAIETHEPKCVKNPNRSVCGWHSGCPTPTDFTARFAENLDLDWLHDEMDGCPSCMLAVVVQADLSSEQKYELGFRYEDAVEEYRKREREEASHEF